MSLSSSYKVSKGKLHLGPGGFRCRCCNKFSGRLDKAKVYWRRYFRRREKIGLFDRED